MSVWGANVSVVSLVSPNPQSVSLKQQKDGKLNKTEGDDMQCQWVLTFKNTVNTYTCIGCTQMCVVEGEKPTTCIMEKFFHEVDD
jgi:hypothetical protein